MEGEVLQTDEFREKAWKKLTDVARAQSTIPYGKLKTEIGWPGTSQSIGRLLDKLFYEHCQPKLPDISSVVVRADTQQPGIGFYKSTGGKEDLDFWRKERALAWKFNWPASLPARNFQNP
jgi:hypothetical protein